MNTKTHDVELYVPSAYDGTIRQSRPHAAQSWVQRRNFIDQYRDLLEVLGMDDPTASGEPYERALRLRAAARAVSVDDVAARQRVAVDLAAGTITPAEAEKQLGKVPLATNVAEAAKQERATLKDAALKAYAQAIKELAAYGEEAWLALLQEQAQAALDNARDRRSEERWTATFELYQLLRQVGGVRYVKGVMPDNPAWWCGRLHEMQAWRVEHARYVATRDAKRVDETWYHASLLRGAPSITFPVIAAHRDEWQVGLHGPEEALALLQAADADRRRVFDETPGRAKPRFVAV